MARKSASKLSGMDTLEQEKKRIVETLSGFTGHKHVRLVHRGNAAILAALLIVKKVNPKPFILIPDQGGWISFRTYPMILGFEVKRVKTNRGVIDLIDLEKKAESGAAFIVTSFAGYFAEQPISYISKICRRHKCLLIEDASGSVGDDILCDGHYSDMIVASFGRWKPVDVGYGGFISTNDGDFFERGSDIFSAANHYPCYDILADKLEKVGKRLKKMLDYAEHVKSDLERLHPGLRIVHRELRGINVVVLFMSPEEKKEIVGYCEKNGFEYVVCPKYIRLDEDAISIELKRIGEKKKG